ncbi:MULTISPECIES: twin transmembrane helix small protein [Iodidimonas]|jgi:uncharacterized membrane protein YjgN (DUF898 family)|uniref:HIG1 domain-containing protein n=1 Tax=Iodidimonas nitroreducens TaxID=1236968 RepID=A0A5A7NCX1_9PROT|nr:MULTISPECIES: twin transmembrane helix small protein [Iodidimonas]GAK34011.1 hypothetical protein AQ1_01905 [alpha proteobacterium Q-1]GER05475.1 hypothetical protein JCM17846_31570 [Iodidimonas nitroreducens]
MSSIFLILIPIFMIAALGAVLLGVLNMARQGKASQQRSNKLMQYRVLFQFIAVILMGLLFFMAAG